MICLDYQDACLPDSLLYQGRDKPKIGNPGKAGRWVKQIALSPLKIKPDRVVCVVGHAEWMNFELFKLEGLPGFKTFPVWASGKFWLYRIDGVAVANMGRFM